MKQRVFLAEILFVFLVLATSCAISRERVRLREQSVELLAVDGYPAEPQVEALVEEALTRELLAARVKLVADASKVAVDPGNAPSAGGGGARVLRVRVTDLAQTGVVAPAPGGASGIHTALYRLSLSLTAQLDGEAPVTVEAVEDYAGAGAPVHVEAARDAALVRVATKAAAALIRKL